MEKNPIPFRSSPEIRHPLVVGNLTAQINSYGTIGGCQVSATSRKVADDLQEYRLTVRRPQSGRYPEDVEVCQVLLSRPDEDGVFEVTGTRKVLTHVLRPSLAFRHHMAKTGKADLTKANVLSPHDLLFKQLVIALGKAINPFNHGGEIDQDRLQKMMDSFFASSPYFRVVSDQFRGLEAESYSDTVILELTDPNEWTDIEARVPDEWKGIVDPLTTPQSEKVGFVLRLAADASIEHGRIKPGKKLLSRILRENCIFPENSARQLYKQRTVFETHLEMLLGQHPRVRHRSYRGQLSGIHLRTAVMMDRHNFEDLITISDEAAEKMRAFSYKVESFETMHPVEMLVEEGQSIKPGDALARINITGRIEVETASKIRRIGTITNIEEKNTKIAGIDARRYRITICVIEPLCDGDKLCYAPGHEVLTLSGWKPISEITLEDWVATLNPQTHRLEYQQPEQVQTFQHDGPMYSLDSQQVELLVTPDHSLYVQQHDRAGHELIQARDVIGTRVRHKKDALWTGSDIQSFVISSQYQEKLEVPGDLWVEFMAWFITRGSTHHGKGGNYEVKIAQSLEENPNKYQEISRCLESLPWSSYQVADGHLIRCEHLYRHLRHLGGDHEKFVPAEIKVASSRQLRRFLEIVAKGDGSENASGSWSIVTSSARLRDDLQEIALKAGWSANYKIIEEPGEKIIQGKLSRCDNAIYRVGIVKTKNTPAINHGQLEAMVPYSGSVHCCTVPNHTIYVRRNGKPVWCGNTNRHGGKGVVRIVPVAEMPYEEHEGFRTYAECIVNPITFISRRGLGFFREMMLHQWLDDREKEFIDLDHFSTKKSIEWLWKRGCGRKRQLFMAGAPLEHLTCIGSIFWIRCKQVNIEGVNTVGQAKPVNFMGVNPDAGKISGSRYDPTLRAVTLAKGLKHIDHQFLKNNLEDGAIELARGIGGMLTGSLTRTRS